MEILQFQNIASIVTNSKILTLMITLVGFTAVITIHEFGHFIFCKLFGVAAPTFSIGMGPAIIKKKICNTVFQISAIPLGGYVEIENADLEAGEPLKPNSFNAKPYWQKFIIMIGGIAFNIISAYIAYVIILATTGMPSSYIKSLKVSSVSSSGISHEIINPNDEIIGIDNSFFEEENIKIQDFFKNLKNKAGSAVKLTVLRDGQKKTLSIDIPEAPQKAGILGVSIDPQPKDTKSEPVSIPKALSQAYKKVLEQILAVKNAIMQIVAQKSVAGLAGPVMILSQSFKIAQSGFVYFTLFLCFISINIALLNLLPLGLLDGGQILTVTIEAIAGRPLPTLKTILFFVSAGLLGTLTIFLSYKEIRGLITDWTSGIKVVGGIAAMIALVVLLNKKE